MGNWQLDPYHTQVEFSAKHLGMMTVRGHFDEVSATADSAPSSTHPSSGPVHQRRIHDSRRNMAVASTKLPVPNHAPTIAARRKPATASTATTNQPAHTHRVGAT